MRQYLLGLDNGGTVTKAALFDLSGRQIALASEPTPVLTPEEGHSERDMQALWQANCRVIQRMVEKAKGSILALGISGHGKGLYLLDKANRPLGNGIGSTDTRALPYELQWAKDKTADSVYGKTYQKVMACQPVALLRWMKDNRPEVYGQIGAVLSVKDYIRFCLTGKINTEYTDLSGTNLLNLNTRDYDDSLLEAFGIGEIRNALAPIIRSAEVCGGVSEEAARQTGLAPGTPVAGGMFDIDACAVAMGMLSPEDLCTIAGTWSINEYISPVPVGSHMVSMNSLYCDEAFYLAEESSAASAGNLEWFKALLGNQGYAQIDSKVQSLPSEECRLYYLPFLHASNVNPLAAGSLIGLKAHHTDAHILRAVMEGVAFSHRTHIERLLQSRKPPKCIRLAGGAAHSDVWAHIFADVLGFPLEVIDDTELGCKGAAMAAGIAAGQYKDFADAAKQCVATVKRVDPNPEGVEQYRKKYAVYQAIISGLDSVWEKL